MVGWGAQTPVELQDPTNAAAFLQEVEDTRSSAEDAEFCPMRWVTDLWGVPVPPNPYNSKRSAFWRTANQVTISSGISILDPVHWSSALVWSNLYKVAPATGGNPNQKLKHLQKDACRKILENEISTYRPKRLVFASGADWADYFLDLPCFSSGTIDGQRSYVERVGDLIVDGEKIGKYVVAAHPQGKNETIWVEEVMAGLESQ